LDLGVSTKKRYGALVTRFLKRGLTSNFRQHRALNIEIGFNAQYLLELLRYMPTDEVKMTFKAPERAATIQPLGNEDTPDYLCLVMPLRLLS